MFIISTNREQRAAASLADDSRFGVITAWIAGLRKEAETTLIAAGDAVTIHRMQGRIEVMDALLQLAENAGKPSNNAPHVDNALKF